MQKNKKIFHNVAYSASVITADATSLSITKDTYGIDFDFEAGALYFAEMEGKRVLVCYVADDGSISYIRAKYENGFVSFSTNHFSHYALVTTPTPSH